jgi:DNA-binding GntR family transcriptional regulator
MNGDRSGVITKEEYVTQRLREMVIAGILPQGERLRQQQIATEFGVSATPVREALRRLVSEGYLTSSPHAGVSVARPDIHHAEEIYEIRGRLEGYLAGLATPRMTRERIAGLRQLNEQFRQAYEKRDFVEARLFNYRLHHVIWEAAERPVTLKIVEGLWGKFPFSPFAILGVPGRPNRTYEEHERLIQALESGDGEAAERSIVEHITSGRHDFSALSRSDDGERAERLLATE